jgi:hypothetical protein
VQGGDDFGFPQPFDEAPDRKAGGSAVQQPAFEHVLAQVRERPVLLVEPCGQLDRAAQARAGAPCRVGVEVIVFRPAWRPRAAASSSRRSGTRVRSSLSGSACSCARTQRRRRSSLSGLAGRTPCSTSAARKKVLASLRPCSSSSSVSWRISSLPAIIAPRMSAAGLVPSHRSALRGWSEAISASR